MAAESVGTAHLVDTRRRLRLADYEGVAQLSGAVRELTQEAHRLAPVLKGRRVWMINSTRQGGGVAEMLPALVGTMRELGVDAGWLVMETAEPEFFRLTKRLHNLIHGEGDANLGPTDRQLYERVSREAAEALRKWISPGDVIVVHDPQPMYAGAILRQTTDILAIWKCHIGLDRDTPQTRAAWAFLDKYAAAYDRAVFTAPEYIPGCLAGRAAVIPPGIDPLSHKNRDLPIHKLVGILVNSGLVQPFGPVLTSRFPKVALRLEPDGGWRPPSNPNDIGLLFRPIVTQISRWDRLKGFLPLLQGFVALKQSLDASPQLAERRRRTLELARLVLAGPDPASIADDPEGHEVLAEISAAYARLAPALQEAIVVISLPMRSQKHNALMVNALQRCSDVVAQNSLREGFGLTATEAMWKRIAVMGTQAAGLRQQIRHGLDGWLVEDAEDPTDVARALDELLRDPRRRERLARNAQLRVHDNYLLFTQVRRWLELIVDAVGARRGQVGSS
jgi:trehalose synthase